MTQTSGPGFTTSTADQRPDSYTTGSPFNKGTRSGLKALSAGVASYFSQNNVQAVVGKIGWRSRFRVDNQGPGGGSRVIFIPGEYDGSTDFKPMKGGELTKPRHSHVEARELVWWRKTVTLSVWGADRINPDDDEAQIEATEALFEWAVRGVHNAIDPMSGRPVGLADVVWKDVTWVKPPSERAFGLEMLVTFEHQAAMFDVAGDLAYPLGVVTQQF
jgi:hypothetical protein